jgi:hypothetical protein
MKNLFLLFVILGITTFAKTQGNLQFNRVINYQLKADINYASSFWRDTVMFCIPANKVWKIENVGLPSCSNCSLSLATSDAQGYGTLNPWETWRLYWYSSNIKEVTNFPIWLTSNFCGQFTYNTSGGQNSTGLISIIEFNIVP